MKLFSTFDFSRELIRQATDKWKILQLYNFIDTIFVIYDPQIEMTIETITRPI